MHDIVFYSEPAECRMDDSYFEYARPDHFWIRWRFEMLRRGMPEHTKWLPLLDVGCGNGVVLEQIRQCRGEMGEGADLNLLALEGFIPSDAMRYFYDVTQARSDMLGRYRTVLLMDVLEHVQDPAFFLESVVKHLEPGGLLAINVPALNGLYSRYDELQGHTCRYSKHMLLGQLQDSGLDVEDIRYWGITLIPIAWLRKQLVAHMSDEAVMSSGFNPSRAADKILTFLSKLEMKFRIRFPIGTSLMAIARKPQT